MIIRIRGSVSKEDRKVIDRLARECGVSIVYDERAGEIEASREEPPVRHQVLQHLAARGLLPQSWGFRDPRPVEEAGALWFQGSRDTEVVNLGNGMVGIRSCGPQVWKIAQRSRFFYGGRWQECSVSAIVPEWVGL
ncbi:MAG: hypothetical protein D6812_04835 [Deltaproteobacteria bacterium]|nr:MAG: hypothetical protein D6812_04835 [Deltaproteobacteria bacterium]